jgi:hypothetical protein
VHEFDLQLLRLKQALRLTEDKDVAAMLGMTKAAFSARKVRQAFPADKVKALAADRPDLNLDVKYILTGESDELDRRLSALAKATRVASRVAEGAAVYDAQSEIFKLLVGELSPEEQVLVHRFRNSDHRGREAILATATAMSANAPAPNVKKKGEQG